MLGVAIALSAIISGVLVAWHPLASTSPLLLPFAVSTSLFGVHVLLTALLVREPHVGGRVAGWRAAAASAKEAPKVVADGVHTLRVAPVLRSLVLVEVFWSIGMIAFETLNPVRLAELVGGEDRAGAIYGPAAAGAWALFAAASLLSGLTSRRIGVAWTALLARVLNGAFVVAMNSMVGGGCYSLGLLVLGPLAEHTSTASAILVAGGFSIIGAVLDRPAIRAERAGSQDTQQAPADSSVLQESAEKQRH